MPRLLHRLTEQTVKSISTAGLHADGLGLYLQVSREGTRSWVFRYGLNGRTRDMGLGRAAEVTLSQARRAAGEARALKARGIDPIDERKERLAASRGAPEQKSSPTFEAFAEEYISAREGLWKNEGHRRQWRQSLEDHAYAVIGEVPVSDVTTAHMLQILDPIWLKIPEMANRVRSRIERILAAAAVKGVRSAPNVALWKGHLSEALPVRPAAVHHAALPFAEIPKFMSELRAIDTVTSVALQFLILNASRSGEVRFATWSEISERDALWIIPAARMKASREHRVPLSPSALALLARMKPLQSEGDFIFPGQVQGSPLSENAMLALVQKQLKRSVSVHGFRSAFRDFAGDATDHPREVAEAALAHSVGDQTERAYRRSTALEKRRLLMSDWEKFCSGGEIIDLTLKRIPAA